MSAVYIGLMSQAYPYQVYYIHVQHTAFHNSLAVQITVGFQADASFTDMSYGACLCMWAPRDILEGSFPFHTHTHTFRFIV